MLLAGSCTQRMLVNLPAVDDQFFVDMLIVYQVMRVLFLAVPAEHLGCPMITRVRTMALFSTKMSRPLNRAAFVGTDKAEQRRVESCGGCVLNGRVSGMLAVTRAIGDHMFKGAAALGFLSVPFCQLIYTQRLCHIRAFLS
jgi:hypothetical protein